MKEGEAGKGRSVREEGRRRRTEERSGHPIYDTYGRLTELVKSFLMASFQKHFLTLLISSREKAAMHGNMTGKRWHWAMYGAQTTLLSKYAMRTSGPSCKTPHSRLATQ